MSIYLYEAPFSARAFSSLFTLGYGRTPSSLLQKLRVNSSESMLRLSPKDLSEVI